jgi:pantetheine-phosphate adenylyltransferase
MNVAIYPGSFDPVTAGHLDVIRRASKLFDHVVTVVGSNPRKRPRLSSAERARLVEQVTAELENVSVEVVEGLLVDFAREQGARVIVKGLRNISDFESEFKQAQLNRKLYPELETVLMMSYAKHSFLSSSAVREIATSGGEVRGLVPEGMSDIVGQMYGEHKNTSPQCHDPVFLCAGLGEGSGRTKPEKRAIAWPSVASEAGGDGCFGGGQDV